jgi:FtsZ-binding cell division protein ZapB
LFSVFSWNLKKHINNLNVLNQELVQTNNVLEQENRDLQNENDSLNKEKAEIKTTIESITEELKSLWDSIEVDNKYSNYYDLHTNDEPITIVDHSWNVFTF